MEVFNTRWEFIRPWVVGRKVLDVGPAELVGTDHAYKMERWIHRKVGEVSGELTGLEINREQVEALTEKGFNIIEGGAESFQLGKTYEVVLAGELIEHLSNPGLFLDRAREHLVERGILLLTTPNRYSIDALKYILRHRKVPSYNKEIRKHVCYFDSDGINSLLKRHGFETASISYCHWVGEPSENPQDESLLSLVSEIYPVVLPVLAVAAYRV